VQTGRSAGLVSESLQSNDGRFAFSSPGSLTSGISTEFGTLRDAQTGADTNRKAAAIHMGYGSKKIALSSAVEYRRDNAEQPDLTRTLMTVWLFRNNGKIQLTPDWRLIGKLDYSVSEARRLSF